MTASRYRRRWWDYSCKMTLYSETAAKAHWDCRKEPMNTNRAHYTYVRSRRVPERKRTQVGAVSKWRRRLRKTGQAGEWTR